MSRIKSVDIPVNQNTFKLYPNPSPEGKVYINLNSDNENSFQLKIINQWGTLVERQTIDAVKGVNTIALDLKHLPMGLYHVFIGNGPWEEVKRLVLIH